MARPLSATDDEILDAAQTVMARRGVEAFTVSEVARELGLTRTAIALRFKGTEDLKRTLLERQVAEFDRIFRDLDTSRGAQSLLWIADLIGQLVGGRDALSSFLLKYSGYIDDVAMRRLEERRGEILRDAVRRAMLPVSIPAADAADAFMANLTGTLINWQSSEEPDVRQFLRARTLNWLRLAGIPVDQE